MEEYKVIVVGEQPSSASPDPAVADLWDRAAKVLRHYAWLNTDEGRVRDLQFGILQNSAFIVPSLFKEGGDFCCESYYFRHRVFYRFAAEAEEYFWITSVLDRCYSLAVMYLPARRLALSLYPFTADADLLAQFEALRARAGRPATAPQVTAMPAIVVGFTHMIHHLWNELPALERAIEAGLLPRMRVIATQQPMGPLDQIFPELGGRVEAMPLASAEALNGSVTMFTALGARSIPAVTQARVIRVARQLATPATILEQERFRARYSSIFWLSAKPPERTCADQPAALAAIIQGLHAAHPGAGFLIDGVSYPWDWQGPYYPGWFQELLSTAVARTVEITDATIALLPPLLRPHVRVINDVSVLEEIGWAGLADFYFCHGGSMQNKIGWMYPTPGVVHSNASFIASARGMIPPLERQATVHYLPAEMVIEDDPAGYTPLQLARKDQNYRFADIEAVIEFILERFASGVASERAASFDALSAPRGVRH